MAFADEKENLSTKRITLARLSPKRRSNANVFTLINPEVGYSHQPGLAGTIIERVTYGLTESTVLTKVTGTDENDLSANEWLYNADNDRIYVDLTGEAVIQHDLLIFNYSIHYTNNETDLIDYFNAGDGSYWKARIVSPPTTTQSIRNIITNFNITSSTSQLVLANIDNDINQYFTTDDTFSNVVASVWTSLNGETTRSFEGLITNVTLGGDRVNFGLRDKFSLVLDKPMTYGDAETKVIANVAGYPNLRESDIDRPVPIVMGWRTPYFIAGTSHFTKGRFPLSTASTVSYQKYNHSASSAMRGINTNKNTHRDWLLARYDIGRSLYTKTSGFAAVTNYSNTGFLYPEAGGAALRINKVFVFGSVAAVDAFEVGQHLVYTTPDGTFNGVVTGMNKSSSASELYVHSEDTFTGAHASGVTIGSIEPTPFINIVQDNKIFWPIPDVDFTVSEETLDNTTMLKLTFVSDFEDECFGGSYQEKNNASQVRDISNDELYMSPMTDADEVLYYFKFELEATESGDWNHSDVVKNIFENSGFNVNAASFATAKADLVSETLFTIPFADSINTLGSMRDYIEAIIQNTVATVHYNNIDDEIFYNLLELPDTNTNDIDRDLILNRSLSVKIDYQDITQYISYENIHIPVNFDLTGHTRNRRLGDPATATLFHSQDKNINIRSVMRDIITGDRDRLLSDLRAERFLSYEYSTATNDIDRDIFEDINLITPKLLGVASSDFLKVIEYSRNENQTTIKVSDLLGL